MINVFTLRLMEDAMESYIKSDEYCSANEEANEKVQKLSEKLSDPDLRKELMDVVNALTDVDSNFAEEAFKRGLEFQQWLQKKINEPVIRQDE